jgi:hypothetical protein
MTHKKSFDRQKWLNEKGKMASKNVESVASVQDNSLSEYGFGALSCPPRCALVYRVVNEVFLTPYINTLGCDWN